MYLRNGIYWLFLAFLAFSSFGESKQAVICKTSETITIDGFLNEECHRHTFLAPGVLKSGGLKIALGKPYLCLF